MGVDGSHDELGPDDKFQALIDQKFDLDLVCVRTIGELEKLKETVGQIPIAGEVLASKVESRINDWKNVQQRLNAPSSDNDVELTVEDESD